MKTLASILLFFGLHGFVQAQDEQKLHYEVGGYASVDWGYRYMVALNDTSSSLLTTIANANSQDKFGLRGSFGFSYSQEINSRLRLYTGMGYSLKGFTSFNNVVVHDTSANYNPYNTSFNSQDVHYHNYSYMFHFLEIPFGVGLMFPMGNYWRVIGDAGVYGGIMILARNPRCKGDTDQGNPAVGQYYGEQTPNRHSIQGSFSLLFKKWHPEKKYSFEIGPEVRLSLFNTYFEETYSQHKSYLYSVGLKFRMVGVFDLQQFDENQPIEEPIIEE